MSRAQQLVEQIDGILESGQKAIADPSRVAAFLVTTADPVAQKTALQLWGSAQQVNLTVGGVLSTPSLSEGSITGFDPLPCTTVGTGSYDAIASQLPDFMSQAQAAPRPMTIDLNQRQVTLFLPGFEKSQVKLIQSGPELTIEAGDQRRNLLLPQALQGGRVTGAKFQNSSLIITV